MSNRSISMTEELYEYMLSISLREHNVLHELRIETLKMNNAVMQISPEQGQFMALLVKLISAKKTLDIGVFTGYSSLVVALALPADGKVYACDVNERWTSIARRFWRKADVEDKIELYIAPAEESLKNFILNGLEDSFDFAFIDADKENYDIYYKYSLKLLKKGGLIAIDNVFRHGRVLEDPIRDPGTKVINRLCKEILEDERVDISLVPISDGLFIVRKK